MMKNLVLFFLALLPVIILGCYIYNKDRNKEPKKILIKLFCGGLLSAVITLLLSYIIEEIFPYFKLDSSEYNLFGIFIYSFLIVGFIEEFSKWIILYLFSYNDKEFDELYDMIVYSVFVSLGFAWIENIFYVYDGGIGTAILRMFLSVPIHVSMGVFMGNFLSLAKLSSINNKVKVHKKYILLSIVVPFILHGIYDYCIFSANNILLIFLLIFIVVLYINTYKKIKLFSSLRTNLIIKYCPNCGKKIEDKGIYCSRCGKKLK